MQIVAETSSLRKQIHQWRREGQFIAFVPTMGEIHDGHLALIREARDHADVVIVSIFADHLLQDRMDENDTSSRILEQDIAILKEHGVALVFTPTLDEIGSFNSDQQIHLEVPCYTNTLLQTNTSQSNYSTILSTTMCKLFNIVQPDFVCFGENNLQRLAIIQRLIKDLCFPIKLLSVATVREVDGLVTSRRNKKLTVDERQRAAVLAKTLRWASAQVRGGRRDFNELLLDCKDQLRAAGLEPDEVQIRDAASLQLIQESTEKMVISASVKLSNTMLIDNLVIDINSPAAKQTQEEEE